MSVQDVPFIKPNDKETARQVALGNRPINYLRQTNDSMDPLHERKHENMDQPKTRPKLKYNDFEKKSYKANLEKIKYNGPEYKYYYDLRPLLLFYKFLAKKTDMQEVSKHSNLKLWIPDTVVYNDDWAPFWLYCSEDGYVYKTENFTEKHLQTKIGNPNNHNEVVAVTKYIDHDENDIMSGHQTQTITTEDLIHSLQSYNPSNGQACAIQRFVKCNGPNAFVCRTAWFKDKSNESWIITNKK